MIQQIRILLQWLDSNLLFVQNFYKSVIDIILSPCFILISLVYLFVPTHCRSRMITYIIFALVFIWSFVAWFATSLDGTRGLSIFEKLIVMGPLFSAVIYYCVTPTVSVLAPVFSQTSLTPEDVKNMVEAALPHQPTHEQLRAMVVDTVQAALQEQAKAFQAVLQEMRTTTPVVPPVQPTEVPVTESWQLPVVLLTYELFIVVLTLSLVIVVWGLYALIQSYRNYGGRDMVLMQESFRAGSEFQSVSMSSAPRGIFGVYSKNYLGSLTYVGTGFRMGEYVYTAQHVLKAVSDMKGEVVLKVDDRIVKSPVWVPIYPDVVATQYNAVGGLELRSLAPSGASCGYTCTVLSASREPNSSMGNIKHKDGPTLQYTGSTRPGFSGSPILSSLGPTARVMALHLCGGQENLCVSAQYLDFLTRNGLKPYAEPEASSSAYLDHDSATKILSSYNNARTKVKVVRRDLDQVFVMMGDKFHSMPVETYDSWFDDANARAAHLECATSEDSKNGMSCSLSSTVDSLTTSPSINISPMDALRSQKDILGQSPLVKVLNDHCLLMQNLQNFLETTVFQRQNESVASSSPSAKEQTVFPQSVSLHLHQPNSKKPSGNSTSAQAQDSGLTKLTQRLETLLGSMESTLTRENRTSVEKSGKGSV
nr:hypothetical protein [Solemoviridae sp.]